MMKVREEVNNYYVSIGKQPLPSKVAFSREKHRSTAKTSEDQTNENKTNAQNQVYTASVSYFRKDQRHSLKAAVQAKPKRSVLRRNHSQDLTNRTAKASPEKKEDTYVTQQDLESGEKFDREIDTIQRIVDGVETKSRGMRSHF